MEPRVLLHDAKGAGEPLVLVPGGLTGWLSWVPHQERLKDEYRVFRVQPIHNELGSAGQRGDPSYTSITERESLRLTLESLGIDRTHLCGWSGGGRAAIEFALQYPVRVRTLTLVEPAAYWILEELGEDTAAVEHVNGLVHGLEGTDVSPEDLAEFLEIAGFVRRKEDASRHPNWERWLPHRMALSWQGEQVDRSDRTVDELANIRCPVLLFKGTVTAGWLRRVVDVLGERLPNASVIELEGDHACHIESIDAFLSALRRHLTGARASN
jgi:pimeloyl-ACP methyl ester carboxylesterase